MTIIIMISKNKDVDTKMNTAVQLEEEAACHGIQGYLAHKKTPTPLGPP